MFCGEKISFGSILFWFLMAVASQYIFIPVAFACAATVVQSAGVQPQEVSDNDILEAVELEFRSDDALTPDTIDVLVAEGIVTLGGETQTLLAKRQAVRAVGSLKGVRGIVNQIRVSPTSVSGDELLAAVIKSLHNRVDMKLDEVTASAGADGNVTLSGTSRSHMARQLTETLVANVRGVTSIDNQIRVVADADRSATEIKSEILRRFGLSPYIAEGLIVVNIDDRTVRLSGAVGSVNEKDLAEMMCWVAGVERVDVSGLSVDPSKEQDRRSEKFVTLKNDVTLQKDVEDVLMYDPRVKSAGIHVSTKMGAVVLSGNVKTLSAKQAAGRDAINTLGVRRVINNLKVKVDRWPGDLEVTKAATSALESDAQLWNLKLTPSSHFGTLYVRGTVNTVAEYNRVASVLADVNGVRRIVNRVRVDRQETDLHSEDVIEDTIRRLRWSPFLNADDVKVELDGGIVTLRGTVDTWQDRRDAERITRQSGANHVRNLLKVRLSNETSA